MSSHKVLITQFGVSVEVKKGFTILDAALKAGLDYPYACRQGNCSSCKTLLRKGSVDHKPYDVTALTPEEKADNIILACRAMPTSDCEVEFLEEDENTFSPSKRDCVVTSVERVTPAVAVVRAKASGAETVLFDAGQFATLTFPGFPAREFSLANKPGAVELEFHVLARNNGHVSQFIYEKCKSGDEFVLNAPFGTAYLRKDHPGPITLVVGGTGLAPAKSIALESLSSLPGREVSLYFSVRHHHDLYLGDQFQALAEKYNNFKFFPVVTRPEGRMSERTTDVFASISTRFKSLQGHKVYTCGSPGLVSACQKFASDMGVSSGDCHADPFVVAEQEEIAS